MSYLLFANDTLIFCEANNERMKYLSWVFMWFEALSKLKVNMDKSEVILIGRVQTLKDVASVMECKSREASHFLLGCLF